MKKQDLFTLRQGLNNVASYPGAKFAYCIAKNIAKVTEECKLIESIMKPSDKYSEYDQKRVELAKEFCDKNEDGSPKTEGNAFVISAENRVNFEVEHTKLRAEYVEEISEFTKQQEDFNILLQEESDLVLFKISDALLPEDITASQVVAIMEIIEE